VDEVHSVGATHPVGEAADLRTGPVSGKTLAELTIGVDDEARGWNATLDGRTVTAIFVRGLRRC
jgi:hypothetical protein